MRNPRCWPARASWQAWSLILLTATACGRSPVPPPVPVASDEIRPFTGTWIATGTRQTLTLEPGRQAAIFNLTGSLLLSGKERLKLGFKADVIGFSDTSQGMQGRSVWTDDKGEKVFSELRGQSVGPGNLVEGRFVGGTGRYAGVSGEYSFTWKYLVDNEEGMVSGRVVGLKGWARLASPGVASSTAGGQP